MLVHEQGQHDHSCNVYEAPGDTAHEPTWANHDAEMERQ